MLMRQCGNFSAWSTRPFEIGPQALCLALAPATFYPAATPDGLSPFTPGEGQSKSRIFQNSKDWCSTSFRLQLWVSVTYCRNKTRMGAVVPKLPVWKTHSCKRQREFKVGGISCLCMIHLCGSLILGCLSFFISGVIFFFPYPVIF